MKNTMFRISTIFIFTILFVSLANAQMKKVGQSGLTYLDIPIGAREAGMGNASVANVEGIQGLFYNQAVLAQIKTFAVVANQVSWLADIKLYGLGAAYSLGNYGTIGLDLVFMDYGEIIGTRRVDASVNERGFITTGDINVEEYAIGVAYAYQINEKFSFGGKIKFVRENLGDAPIAVGVVDQEAQIFEYENRNWSLNNWGFDVGAFYDIGYKSLKFAAALQNYSADMTYWTESFAMPMSIRFGLAMDIAETWDPGNDDLNVNVAVDGVNPVDYTGRFNVGAEFEYLQIFAVRAGYQSNHDLFDFSLGFGVKFDYEGFLGSLDYAYTNTLYFDDINRFSFVFAF